MSTLLHLPALWLLATLAAYLFASWLHKRCANNAMTHPLLVAVLLVLPLLWLTGTPYEQYFSSAQFIHLLLGPATVALAVPLYANLSHVRRVWRPLLLALTVGGLVGILSAILIGRAFGLPHDVLISFAPKSVTTPIAMALADKLGGNTSLAAAAVIVTGIVGALCASGLFKLLRIRDEAVQGFAIGLASHGVGTTRALQISLKAGAFSGLGMSLNGIFTSIILPAILALCSLN